jgi:aminoglycoside phosphotransferase (APT) family kinase protein
VAQFLGELHGFVDVNEARRAGIPLESQKTRSDDLKGWLDMPGHWKPFLMECIERVESVSCSATDLRFLHYDCHGDNVLWDLEQRRLTGIIDFGDVVIGDSHADLAIGGFIDLHVLDAIIDGYPFPVDRRRVWDLYVIASASDIARHTFDCTADVEHCYRSWLAGKWPG